MGSKDSRPKAQALLEIKLLDFLYGEWGVKRELLATPTITIPAGTQVSIQLQENVSFSHEPTLTK